MPHPLLLNGRSLAGFKAAFHQLIEPALLKRILVAHGPPKRRPPEVSLGELIMALVFHCLQGAGTLAANLKACTGKKVSDSALSQRRQNLAWEIFSTIMQAALCPIAQKRKHPQAFYRGLRLVGMDGSQFSLSNTSAILKSLRKAASRRMHECANSWREVSSTRRWRAVGGC